MTTSKFAESLSKTCCLLQTNMTRFSGTISRKDLAEATALSIGARKESGKYVMDLVPKDIAPSHDQIRKLDGYLRNQVIMPWTTPTRTKGVRLATVDVANKLKKKLDAAITERNELINQFIDVEYPKVLEQAPEFLGSAYRKADYPSQMELRNRYSMSVRFTSMSDTNPNIIGMPADIMQQIEGEMVAEQNALRELASDQVTQNLVDQMDKVVGALSGYKTEIVVDHETGTKKELVTGGVFRDSLMTNLHDRAQQAVMLDISIERHAASIGQKILDMIKEGHIHLSADHLRASEVARDATVASINSVRPGKVIEEQETSIVDELVSDDWW